MQSQESDTRSAGAVNHPSAAEWMAYLYDEIAPERRRELHVHLAQCGDCGQRLNRWRAGMAGLNEWRLPTLRPPQPRWQPATMLKWATAAAVVLVAGFAIGRQTSRAAGEMAELKASVAQLTRKLESETGFAASNMVAVASAVANEQTLRLLSDYARLDDERRAEAGRTFAGAWRELDARLINLRTELETVAVNTATGFRQTKEGLTTLASYTVPDHGDASDFPKPESKNH
jgi:hypothetical protein